MVETEEVIEITQRYSRELDWAYLERQAKMPENDILQELLDLKGKDDRKEEEVYRRITEIPNLKS